MGTAVSALEEPEKAGAHLHAAPLITTKLRAPVAVASYRPRERVSSRLDRALDDAIRLTLVSAPPGYGKSVAVAGWLASRDVVHAWLSLDAADNDPARFLRYLVAALEPVRAGMAELARPLLGLGAQLATEEAGASLIAAIASADDPLVLVIDDYHLISTEPVHALLRTLIEQGPPFAHLIVVTREDPPLPLPRLRAHGRLVELRADDLRYSEAELLDFLAGVGRVELDAAHVTRLLERTEGWVAGLQLAAISLGDRSDTAALVDAFAGSQRFVLDYLAAEVLERLDAELRDFLVALSVCPRFCPELCRELTDRPNAAALLERAERMNLFLVPLDPERRWYRFHHLFADYLGTLLDEPERVALQERAAAWFEDAGLDGEAIELALAAGSTDRAVALVERAAPASYAAGEAVTLLGWLDALPPERLAGSTRLPALQAAALFFTGQPDRAVRACVEGEARATSEGGLARLRAVRSYIAALESASDARALAQSALDALHDADDEVRAMALQSLAAAQLVTGELEAAAATARSVLQAQRGTHLVADVVAMTTLSTALLLTGQRGEAEELCRRTLLAHAGARDRVTGTAAFAAYRLGIMLYEANELAEARYQLERGWAGAGAQQRVLFNTTAMYLGLARLADGLPAEALKVVRTVAQASRARGLPHMATALGEIEARLCLASGDLAAAAHWADEVAGQGEAQVHRPRFFLGLPRDLTLARVRLAQGRAPDARVLLARARTAAAEAGDHADLISIAVLEARVADATGDHRRAQRALEDAVRLAALEGYVRRIVDDAGPLAPLLPPARRIAPAFVDQLIAALAGQVSQRGSAAGSGAALWLDGQGQPFEALTARELEVLRLLARGCGDAAVADELGLSLATAKWHAAHIRSKLGARSRTQALLRARELGLV